ncbi:MAG: hypothetical protein KGL59_06265 [Acidobacteriota bacterium]|nr:hypothetical protein [Acidobacteriota bacterium]
MKRFPAGFCLASKARACAQSRFSAAPRLAGVLLSVACFAVVCAGQTAGRVNVSAGELQGLHWRSIGPAVFGGRVTAVAGVPGNPYILYAGHSTGGVFKSTDGGVTFHSIFNRGNTLSVGAIAISPANPNVIYVGTGEGNPRNSASFGDGIYKSLDGGKTWKHLGLEGSERFSRIIVNPLDPNIVYAAAMGHEWGPNPERGIFRSADAGRTWKRVLYVNQTTGASDLAFDPQNPNIVYAGMYDYLRRPWHLRSGGPGSGLYRSSDGGETWVKLTDPALHNGLPTDTLGRIGVRVSRSNPAVVYAIIQSRQGLLWRSDDAGARWRMVNDDRNIDWRPFYFSNIRIDPTDENRVYALSRALMVSSDGGRTFHPIPYGKLFGDCHALWIDPANPRRLVSGSDGGLFVSNNRGRDWDFMNNIPMAQVYHMAVDNAVPYHVLGGFQDHEVWRGPSTRWNDVGAKGGDWKRICPFGDGSFVAVDPRDPDIIYYDTQDTITRVDMRNHEERRIEPYPVATAGASAGAMKYRFNWTAPLLISPTNPNVLYYGGNVLFKTTDGGTTWQIISLDLTTNNPKEEGLSGGPVTYDNTTAEFHCTITTISQSPLDANVVWVGTDDGNVQITRDGGKTWTNVVGNIQGLPPESWVSSIKASHFASGTAFVSFDRHQMNDFAPYAYVTRDYGKTWTAISSGLRGYVNIVSQDPRQPNLLYAGTELGIFASFDGGRNWADLRLGLPPLPVTDLKVHPRDNDLIIATHARGFYILDDATPLQQLAAATAEKVSLFKPMPAIRYIPWSDTSTVGGQVWLAKNRLYGSIISYYLKEAMPNSEKVKLTILDSDGHVLRELEGPGARGINRVVWNLRENPLVGIVPNPQKAWPAPGLPGMLAMPGEYTVRLEASGETVRQKLQVVMNPRIQISPADLAAYHEAVLRLVRMDYSIAESLERIRRIDTHLAELQTGVSDPEALKLAREARDEFLPIREDLQPPALSPEHLDLRARLGQLTGQVEDYTGRPTAAQQKYIGVFAGQFAQVERRLNAVISGKLAQLNERLAALRVPYVSPEPELAVKP